MRLTHIKGSTYCIESGLSLIPFYKINDTDIILLDSGLYEEREDLLKLIEFNQLQVKGIINSHAHIDHIGNNAFLKEKYQCLVAMQAFEASICSSIEHLKIYYQGLTINQIKEYLGHLVCEVDQVIHNEGHIEFCGVTFQIIHTPGHSPNHICVVTPDDVCYVGDALMSRDMMKLSKMPYAFILSEDLKSKETLKQDQFSHYILAHKVVIYEDIKTLIEDNIEFYQERANHIFQLIDSGKTFQQIFNQILDSFSIRINHVTKFVVIERMLRSYLDYLVEINLLDIEIKDGLVHYHKKQL